MQGRLSGKTVVVLGASATGGSGWRIAQAFAGAGAHVFVAARSLDKVQVLAAEIG
jgi:NAD(P)-dependent dehydrogenase (short-subunit alcohol dehydrogenase family)